MPKLTLEMYPEEVNKLYEGREAESTDFLSKQQALQDKINNKRALSEDEIREYVLTDSDLEYFNKFQDVAQGKEVKGFDLKDYIASPQATVLIPKIIIGAARRAAEPIYLASKFFKKVRSKNGTLMVSPIIGTMQAQELAEGQAPAIQGLDIELMQQQQFITATKKGIRVQVTEQYINDSQWDLVSYLIEEAGFAMARLKEQLACVEFSKRGWTVFDNAIRATHPEAGTTGLNYQGNFNDTLGIDDFLDLVIALMNNEKTPTDVLMHPLIWTVFARNGLTGALTGPTDSTAKIMTPNKSFPIGPQAVQGRLPFGLTINLSPFVPIDIINRKFDMFVLDRNNVGIQVVQDDLRTDEFRDPVTDIYNFKMIERYNYGTFDEGRGITVAKNISMDKSWPEMDRIRAFS